MQAVWHDTVIAESSEDEVVFIESNAYFPPTCVNTEYVKKSSHTSRCQWKGEALYYDLKVKGKIHRDAAWCYPHPNQAAIERVGTDFSGYIAFWQDVEIVED